MLCPADHRIGHAGELRHRDAVAVIRTARNDFSQECDIVSALLHGDIVVLDTVHQLFQRGQLVIMRCKQRPRADFFLVRDVFHHCTGDGHAVKGRGAAADLIEHNQALRRGMVQNIRHLTHLHHKGRLTGSEIVRCADAGKDAVGHADACTFCRHKAAHLRHQRDERNLTHIRGLTRHVWTGNDCNAVRAVVQLRIICDKHRVAQDALDHRMAAVLNLDHRRIVDLRAHIVVFLGVLRQCCQYVNRGQRLRGRLNAVHLLGKRFAQFDKQLVFQIGNFLLRAEHGVFVFLELLRDVTLGVRQRLLADIVPGHLRRLKAGNLDIIAEYLVISNL